MRRLVVLAAAATLGVAALSAEAATPGVPVRRRGGGDHVDVRRRVDPCAEARDVVLRSACRPDPRSTALEAATRASARTTSRSRCVVRGLEPATTYSYAVPLRATRRVRSGTFETAPPPTAERACALRDLRATPMRRPGPNGKPGFNRFEVYGRMAAEKQRLQHQPRRHDLLGQRGRRRSGRAHGRGEVGEVQARARTSSAAGSSALQRASTATGTTTSSSTTSRVAENGDAIYAAGVKAFTDYAPVAKPSAATGLYRTFRWGKNLELFFLDERSFRSAKATTACNGDLAPTAPQAVRDAFATLAPGLRNPVAAGVSRGDQRSGPDDARRAPVRRVHEGDQGVDGDLEGDRQRGPDPAVLRASVRPLGGLRGRARAAPAVPAGEREERRLPHDRHAREPRERGALQDAWRHARELGHLGGRHRPGRDEHVREGDRRLSSAQKGAGTAIGALFFKPRRRTGWACAAPRSTRTATPR